MRSGRLPGKARRLIVLPLFMCIGRVPLPDTCRKGALGRFVQPSDRIFSRYPYLAEKPEIPRQGYSREGNEHPFELADP